ncbi:uncharacterized protein BDW43DRAFT_273345 [Aspergillus alliaceus]|uniref:uncharacterized protein n=1 Tax=Petromyces alliaceus TaxID=209559 RepID=UPI0012A3EC0E|nr:uncharacterized protein BDW43DRAFT_273345 [Aspergillus alliaceus]KAB8234501.1 hypothetical protein BDW43DRAFT_273345 [Aspergillus alliaceus]
MDIWGDTPLIFAAQHSSKDTAKLLLETVKVNPELRDSFGKTLLSYAAGGGHK